MKIRIVSDIHADINAKKNYQFDFGDDFIVCCGDISGDRFTTEKWVKENIKNGVFIEGNHLGYERITNDINDTKQKSISYLRNKFRNRKVKFLENNIHIIDDVVFIGCTLYTDFLLYNSPKTCKSLAQQCMNDFRYVKIKKGRDKIWPLNPYDTVTWHQNSVEFIDKICKEHPDKKIIVISHHAPSIDCLRSGYKNDLLSAAYSSDLEWIMEENNNLKLWCHGHVHHNVDFIKHGTRVVCNPFGYFNENKNDVDNYGLIIETNDL